MATSGTEWESLQSLNRAAIARGDRKVALATLRKMKELQDAYTSTGPNIELEARRAVSSVKTDPLAGFRKGGPGFEMLQVLEPRAPEDSVKASPYEPDLWKGVAGLGRGVTNLMRGARQIGTSAAESIGKLTQPDDMAPYLEEEAARRQEAIHEEVRGEKEPYGILKKGSEGGMQLAEIVAETAPFINMPVGRLAAPFVSGGLRLLNPAIRAAPEIAAGGAEAAIPYAESPEARTERAQEGAIGATVAKWGTDYLAKRANARREIMSDEYLQEMHDLGADFGIPVRRGQLEGQLEAAGEVAEARTTPFDPGELAAEAAEDLAGQVTIKMNRMERQYDELFTELDKGAYPLQRGETGRLLPKSQMSTQTVRDNVFRYMDNEMKFGGMTDPAVMKEYQRWAELPDGATMSDMHRFRHGLREREPKSNTYAQGKFAELDAFISEELAKRADTINPGAGQMLRNMDHWYYEELPRLRQIPAIRESLKGDPTPQSVLDFLMTRPSKTKADIAETLSPAGRVAVTEAFWNKAYRAGTRGKEFNPLAYAKFLEANMESAGQFMDGANALAFQNLGRLMRHISAEGAAPDVSLFKLIRGFPFYYRALADRVRKSNFLYMLGNVPPDIKPGSPEMERFYRGFIRGIAIQEEGEVSGPLSEFLDVPTGKEVGQKAIGVLQELTDDEEPNL